jgi:hypothetical protein
MAASAALVLLVVWALADTRAMPTNMKSGMEMRKCKSPTPPYHWQMGRFGFSLRMIFAATFKLQVNTSLQQIPTAKKPLRNFKKKKNKRGIILNRFTTPSHARWSTGAIRE